MKIANWIPAVQKNKKQKKTKTKDINFVTQKKKKKKLGTKGPPLQKKL
jgi:hypothetical protein